MNTNFNQVPADSALPDSITVEKETRTENEVPAKNEDGSPAMAGDKPRTEIVSALKKETLTKKPIHVHGVVIADDHTEPHYNVLCTDGTREVIPLSAFKKIEIVQEEIAHA